MGILTEATCERLIVCTRPCRLICRQVGLIEKKLGMFQIRKQLLSLCFFPTKIPPSVSPAPIQAPDNSIEKVWGERILACADL